MDRNLPQPQYQPATPLSGWWKSPASLATDPVFLRVKDEHRLAAVGLYTAAVGWTLTHDASEGWVPAAALLCGQVCAAPREQLEAVTKALVEAGIFVECELDAMNGFIVAGAAKAISERFARQSNASAAGKASAEAQANVRSTPSKYPPRPPRIDPDKPVDWSKVSDEL